MERMKERMTLAHKNTSKWARRVLRRGAKMDPDERKALSLQIAKGDALRRKVMGEDSGDEGSCDGEDTEESLLKKARDILAEKCDITEDSLGKRKGLFELDFMKRGMEAQRARAKDEARRLLEELEANEAAFSTDSEDETDRETPAKKPTKPKVATDEETNNVLPDGKLVASSLEFGKSDAFGVMATDIADTDVVEKGGIEEGVAAAVDGSGGSKKKKKKKSKKKKSSDEAHIHIEEENPWLTATKNETPANNSKSKPPAAKKAKTSAVKVDVNAAASMLVDAPPKKENKSVGEAEKPSKETGLAGLSQAELVKQAFASPDDLEAEKEFQMEKVSHLIVGIEHPLLAPRTHDHISYL